MYLVVEIEYLAPSNPEVFRGWADEHVDRRIELVDHLDTGGFVVCIGLRETTIHAAVNVALAISNGWLADAPEEHRLLEPVGIRAVRRDQRDRLAEIVGIREIAWLLSVSRQRANQLAKTRAFPAPVEQLAMGPVFLRRAVLRYARKTGRSTRHQATDSANPNL